MAAPTDTLRVDLANELTSKRHSAELVGRRHTSADTITMPPNPAAAAFKLDFVVFFALQLLAHFEE